MKLIGLTGLPRAGKDTVAARLVEEYGYARLAFSDPLKEAAAILLGRPVEQMQGLDGFDREAVLPEWGFSTRWFLQRFGTEAIRNNIRPDFWVQHMRCKIERAKHIEKRFVITDCRFFNEIVMIHELGGIVVRVLRPGTAGSDHISDKPVPYDWTLYNAGGFDELYREIDTFMRWQELEPRLAAGCDSSILSTSP